MGSVVDVKPVMSGVRAVLKSQGVTAMVASQGQKAAARCNSMAERTSHMSKAPRYESETVGMRYLNAARVHIGNGEAKVDNLRNNTLKKGCGC